MKTLIIAILLSICFTVVSAQEMKLHIPEMKLLKQNGDYILYENSISSDKAARFYEELERKEVLDPTFYKIPNSNNYFVTAQIRGKTEMSFPEMAFLFDETQETIVEKFRSESFGDRLELKPIFFIGEESVLIMAEKEYMGFHGIEAFEFKEKQLHYLGNLDVAYRAGGDKFYYYENPLKVRYKSNPLEKVKISLLKNYYQIELKGEFYESFDSSSEKKISSENSVVIYKLTSVLDKN